MSGKRKWKRKNLVYYLEVRDTETNALLGHIADITVEGFLLVGSDFLTADEYFAVNILLPEPIQEEAVITVTARCMWSKQDRNPALFASGFLFADITLDQTQIIDHLVERFGIGR